MDFKRFVLILLFGIIFKESQAASTTVAVTNFSAPVTVMPSQTPSRTGNVSANSTWSIKHIQNNRVKTTPTRNTGVISPGGVIINPFITSTTWAIRPPGNHATTMAANTPEVKATGIVNPRSQAMNTAQIPATATLTPTSEATNTAQLTATATIIKPSSQATNAAKITAITALKSRSKVTVATGPPNSRVTTDNGQASPPDSPADITFSSQSMSRKVIPTTSKKGTTPQRTISPGWTKFCGVCKAKCCGLGTNQYYNETRSCTPSGHHCTPDAHGRNTTRRILCNGCVCDSGHSVNTNDFIPFLFVSALFSYILA